MASSEAEGNRRSSDGDRNLVTAVAVTITLGLIYVVTRFRRADPSEAGRGMSDEVSPGSS